MGLEITTTLPVEIAGDIAAVAAGMTSRLEAGQLIAIANHIVGCAREPYATVFLPPSWQPGPIMAGPARRDAVVARVTLSDSVRKSAARTLRAVARKAEARSDYATSRSARLCADWMLFDAAGMTTGRTVIPERALD